MRSTKSGVLPALVLAVLVGSTASCTGTTSTDRSENAAAADSDGTSDQVSAPALPKGVKGATDVPTDVPNDPELRDQVTLEECKAADGGWVAKGTATNSASTARSYTVTVFFTTDSATVIGSGTTKVKTGPDAAESWQVSDDFKAPKGTRCVLRGVG